MTIGVHPAQGFPTGALALMISMLGGFSAITCMLLAVSPGSRTPGPGSVLMKLGIPPSETVSAEPLSQVRRTATPAGSPPARYANPPWARNETSFAGADNGMVFNASDFE